jgi:hypothetical protein
MCDVVLKMPFARKFLPLAGCCLALQACGSSGPSPAFRIVPSTTAPAAPLLAGTIVAALQTAGVPITHSTVYAADTDPNHKLGRPGGYTSKAAFEDTRVKPSQARDRTAGAVDLGGGVEVFPTPAEAVARGRFIQAALPGSQLDGEYDYAAGAVLLRLSEVLTPDQVTAYVAALSMTEGAAVVQVAK